MGISEGVIEIKEEKKGDVLVIRIKGRLDAITSPSTEKTLFERVNGGHHKILLDFGGVSYLSSAGMRMLLSTTKKLKSLSGKLMVCNINMDVMDILKISGFEHVLEISKTEDEALRKF